MDIFAERISYSSNLSETMWQRAISKNLGFEAARRAGLHDPTSERLEDHFGPHCCRHWYCSHLFRNGMKKEYIKELRGDSREEAFDLYNYNDFGAERSLSGCDTTVWNLIL